MNHHVRHCLVALFLLTAGVAVAPTPALAADPTEVTVVPADPTPANQTDSLVLAAASGFLHRRIAGAPLLWTRYADRITSARPTLDGLSLTYQSGDDVLSKNADGTWTLTNVDTLATRTMTPPDGSSLIGFFGDTMVYRTATALSLRRYADDGTSTEVPITGLPSPTTVPSWLGGDATDGLIQVGAGQYDLLDLATGQATPLPDGIAQPDRTVLTTDRVSFVYPTSVVTYQRSAIRAGTAITGTTVTLPQNTDLSLIRLDGDDAIVAPGDGGDVAPAVRYSPGSTSPSLVVASAERSTSAIAQAPDGVLLVGGPDAAGWNVLRFTPTSVGTAYDLHPALVNAGLTLTSGYLKHIQAQPLPGEAGDYRVVNHQLTDGTDAYKPSGADGHLTTPLACADGVLCARTASEDSYGIAYLGAGPSAGSIGLYERPSLNLITALPTTTGTIVDASPGYVVVNGTTQQYVVTTNPPAIRTQPIAGAGLWFRTLWSGATAGTLTSTDLSTGASGISVPTGASCPATDVQATGRYVYWTCGASGPAGVYDLTGKVNVALPAAQYLLGDGYVVRHEANGDLVRVEIATGALATIGNVARGSLADDRNITWTVDKYSGDVAYVDSKNAVHVIDPAVSPSPAAGVHYQDNGLATFTDGGGWLTQEWLTRPIDSWTATVTEVRTGKVVVSTGGGPLISKVGINWDGMLAGKRAPNGQYRYSISGTIGGVTTTLGSGTMGVWCGTPNFRDFTCTGQPSVLGLTSSPAGQAHWLTANSTSVTDGGAAETWTIGSGASQVTAITPFGDTNQDYLNDLLVRRGDGSLRIYQGTGNPTFAGAKSVVVPGSFSQYNDLVSAGDLTGDGFADLIGRDTSTGALFRYNGNGTSGFAAPAQISGTYKSYDRVFGVGDFNGDGKTDLLMLLGTQLWGIPGLGNGTFGSRWLVASGYAGYNVIIGAGDVNDDGHNDLITRDANGVRWLIPGLGTGGVGSRIQLGTGYQKYASMF